MSVTRRAALGLAFGLYGVPIAAEAQTATFPVVSIAGSRVDVSLLTFTGGLFEYRYRVTNASTSDAGVESVLLDVSAPLGRHPDILPSQGLFLFDGTREADNATAGHVPIGVDVPGEWDALILPDGFLIWGAPSEGVRSLDAIPPGSSRATFAVRSPLLPGLRTFRLLPDYPYLCCPYPAGDPRNQSIVVRTQEDFRVEGVTIGPVYEPAVVTYDLVTNQVQAVCAQGWITSAGVCHSLENKLNDASAAVAAGDLGRAREKLLAFLQELDAQHGPEPGKHVTDTAYWLLKTNVELLLSRLAP